MRKILLFVLLIILLPSFSWADKKADSLKRIADSMSAIVKKTKADSSDKAKKESANAEKAKQEATSSRSSTDSTKNCGCIPHPRQFNSFKEWLLVFIPFGLFLTVLGVVLYISKGFVLKDALTENELPKQTIQNPAYNNSLFNNNSTPNLSVLLPPTIEVTVTGSSSPRPSISRYIALITSLITIIIVVCMTSFFIYQYIKTGCPPDFSSLTTPLIALGIGVTPYITNKISTAATANKS